MSHSAQCPVLGSIGTRARMHPRQGGPGGGGDGNGSTDTDGVTGALFLAAEAAQSSSCSLANAACLCASRRTLSRAQSSSALGPWRPKAAECRVDS